MLPIKFKFDDTNNFAGVYRNYKLKTSDKFIKIKWTFF